MANTNGCDSSLLWSIGWLLVLMIAIGVSQTSALTSTEIDALMELGAAVPQFSPHYSSFWSGGSQFNVVYQPLEWPKTREGWANICSSGDGPNVHGLTCRGGHIVTMNWYVR